MDTPLTVRSMQRQSWALMLWEQSASGLSVKDWYEQNTYCRGEGRMRLLPSSRRKQKRRKSEKPPQRSFWQIKVTRRKKKLRLTVFRINMPLVKQEERGSEKSSLPGHHC